MFRFLHKFRALRSSTLWENTIFRAFLYRILKKKKLSSRRAKFDLYPAFFILVPSLFLAYPLTPSLPLWTSSKQAKGNNKLQTHLIVNRSRKIGIAAGNNEIKRKETVRFILRVKLRDNKPVPVQARFQ